MDGLRIGTDMIHTLSVHDYSESATKYTDFGWLNADVIDSKLYKKIN